MIFCGRFTATNVAMGNTKVVPYSYCVDAHAGLDADLISWSFVSSRAGTVDVVPSLSPSLSLFVCLDHALLSR